MVAAVHPGTGPTNPLDRVLGVHVVPTGALVQSPTRTLGPRVDGVPSLVGRSHSDRAAFGDVRASARAENACDMNTCARPRDPPPRGVTHMSRYTLTHLTDSTLLRDLKTLLSQERSATALLIAHLAEVDARRLYAPAGYPSLFNYCVEELHFSEESACRRIRAARVAREYPAVFDLLADGRLHLTAVDLLAPHLTAQNADELLAAAAHKSRAGIERLLAERFPQPDLPTLITPVAPRLSPGTVAPPAPANNFPSPATVLKGKRMGNGTLSASLPQRARTTDKHHPLSLDERPTRV